MDHVIRIFILCIVAFAVVECSNSPENPVISKHILTAIASNVGAIFSPKVLKEIQNNLPNHTIALPVVPIVPENFLTTAKPNTRPRPIKSSSTRSTAKKTRTTTPVSVEAIKPVESTKEKSEIPSELDSARAQQVQLENQFPFNLQNNFPGFSGGPNAQNNFNPGAFRPFPSSGDGSASGVNNPQSATSRPFNSQQSPLDFGRVQDFGRFGGFPGDFNRFFDPSSFGSNFPSGSNFPNTAGNVPSGASNFPNGANFPNTAGSFPNGVNPFQNFPTQDRTNSGASNTADQRFPFQLPSNNFPGAFNFFPNQQNPGFPLFFPNNPNSATPGPATGATNGPQSDVESVSAPERRIDDGDDDDDETTIDQQAENIIENFNDRIQQFPPLNDYSDVYDRSDAFKQYLISNKNNTV